MDNLNRQAKVICLAQHKGGTAKTSSVINIAGCLVEEGYKVLVADLDPQANLTAGLGVDFGQLDKLPTMKDLLAEENCTANDILQHTQFNIDILPAFINLALADRAMPQNYRETVLKRKIQPLRSGYDYILVDTPPSFGVTTVNALAAADYVLIPVQCNPFCIMGLGDLTSIIRDSQSNGNTNLKILGVFATLYESQKSVHRDLLEVIRRDWQELYIPATIRFRTVLEQAPASGKPVTVFAPGSDSHKDYQQLTREVVNRVN